MCSVSPFPFSHSFGATTENLPAFPNVGRRGNRCLAVDQVSNATYVSANSTVPLGIMLGSASG
jgi:hypothetical protein